MQSLDLDPGCPVSAVAPAQALHKGRGQLETPVLDLLDPEILTVVRDPAVGIQVVVLVTPVTEAQVVIRNLWNLYGISSI